MMKLVIDRARWLRGEGGQFSRLLREKDQKMCCLGFLGKACGASDSDLLHKLSPYSTKCVTWPKGLLEDDGLNTTTACHLIANNDNEYLTDDERESRIAADMLKLNIEVEFVG